MAFTVSRRTRQMGIGIALGAERHRIVLGIFRRPLMQVGLGVIAGAGVAGLLSHAIHLNVSPKGAGLVAAYALLMMGVCMLTRVVPSRRALAVESAEALRADG